jgi:hypothetical protein
MIIVTKRRYEMSLQVRAYSPQLLREYPSNVGGEGGVRRAPIILVELTDAHLEQVRYTYMYVMYIQ